MKKKNRAFFVVSGVLLGTLFALAGCGGALTPEGEENVIPDYIVRFDINGGTGTPPPPVTWKYNDESFQFPDGSGFSYSHPILGNLVFCGWSYSKYAPNYIYREPDFAAGTTMRLSIPAFDDDTTFYAQWSPNFGPWGTIELVLNGGYLSTLYYGGTVNAGSSTTLPGGDEVAVTRKGYVFGGWNTNADGTGTNYGGGSQYMPGKVETTLYAQWIPGIAGGPIIVGTGIWKSGEINQGDNKITYTFTFRADYTFVFDALRRDTSGAMISQETSNGTYTYTAGDTITAEMEIAKTSYAGTYTGTLTDDTLSVPNLEPSPVSFTRP